ncbi:MAG: PhzF family phenazine biosynthesis protein [Cyanobacteria bacterium J06621_11]
MRLTVTQVDAFTNQPFSGNPAAVCVTQTPIADELMQAIAAEMNLSETAFLIPIEGGYSLRWFTPETEVDLCGHATLASAHVLWSEGHLATDKIARFNTKSGWLSAKKISAKKISPQKLTKKQDNEQDDWIELDFPIQPVETKKYVAPQLIKALCCHSNIRSVSQNETNYLVEIQSEKALQALQPDFTEMLKLPVQGIIATAKADDDTCDFVSRYFAPAVGINEDPVTGSAHASLAPYWQSKLAKDAMLARQVSARGGTIKVSCEPDNRVKISGQAVTVMKGEIMQGKVRG